MRIDNAVIERRVEMATQCECLAAWDDGRECICNRELEMPVDRDAVQRASILIRQIDDCDRRIQAVKNLNKPTIHCFVNESPAGKKHHQRGRACYADDDYVMTNVADFTIPLAIIIAALNGERADLIRQLSETGVVSVNNAKIRSVLP
jgi:hypothetical protein